jgi:hypothetical protein
MRSRMIARQWQRWRHACFIKANRSTLSPPVSRGLITQYILPACRCLLGQRQPGLRMFSSFKGTAVAERPLSTYRAADARTGREPACCFRVAWNGREQKVTPAWNGRERLTIQGKIRTRAGAHDATRIRRKGSDVPSLTYRKCCCFVGSGGRIRTADTRIMIPLL